MRMAILSMVLAALMAAGAAQAQPTAPAGDLYVIIYRPGPKWDASKTMAQQLGPHGRYFKGLLDDGRLVAGGAMPAINGGLAIFRETSQDAAQTVVAGDPAVAEGIFAAELQRWAPRFDATGVLRPKP